ncbi:MAG: hypothetical protein WC663_00585 [Patescibacteria group bacterium]|jgi:hypothetical protein
MLKRENGSIPEEEISTIKEQPEGRSQYEARVHHEIGLIPEIFCGDEKKFWQQEAKSIKEKAEKELERVNDEVIDGIINTDEKKIQKLKRLEADRDRKLRLPEQAINVLGRIEAELRKGKTENAKKYVDRMLVDTQQELKIANESFERYQKTAKGKYYSNLRQQQSIDQAQFRNISNPRMATLLDRKVAVTNELLEEMPEGKSLESRVTQFKDRFESLQRSKKLLERNKVMTDEEIEKASK